jgi:predicted AlkP superfamily phosphohydrolase/phosphomutase
MIPHDLTQRMMSISIIAVIILTVIAASGALIVGQSLVDGEIDSLSTEVVVGDALAHTADTVTLVENGQLAAHVMWVILEGARADYIEPYIVDGTMANLALLASNGMVTEYVQGCDPPSPAVSFTSLASGSRPRITGVVGERYRRSGQPTNRVTDAPRGVSSAAPAVWAWNDHEDEAQDAILFWPGVHAATDAGHDIVLSDGDSLGPAHVHALDWRTPAGQLDGLPASFSPVFMQHAAIADFDGAPLAEFQVILLDTLDDDVKAYDTVGIGFLPVDADQPAEFTTFQRDSWAILSLPDRPAAGVAFKLTTVAAGEDASRHASAMLYQSQVMIISSQPATLADELVGEIGPPAPAPTRASVDAGSITPGDYLSLAEERVRWQTAAAIYIQERYAPRIMAVSFDLVRVLSEIWLAGNDDGIYDRAMRGGYRSADQAVGRLLAGIDLNQSTVLIGSPHGYESASIALNMRMLLTEIHSAGASDSLAVYSSGGSAHVVVNVAGREPGGTVSGAMFDNVVQGTLAGLREFRLDGLSVFERISIDPELRELGLDSPNSGDIFVQAIPGVVLYDHDPTGEDRLWWFTSEAVAGYDASQPAMRGVFVLAGRSAPTLGIVAPIHLVDIAPTIGEILGIEIPASVEGRVLYELLP